MREQALDPGWKAKSFSPVNSIVFCQPSLPLSTSSAISAPDPATVSREGHPESGPTAAGEEETLPMGLSAPSGGGVKDASTN